MIRDPETLNALLDTVNRFVRERLVPAEAHVAETDEIPEDIVQEMKDMGLFGLTVPESYGGLELTMEEEVMVMLAMGQTSPCFRSLFGTTVGIGSMGIVMDGTPEQQAHWLPRIASGQALVVLAHQERKARYRSDLCDTVATPAGGGWTLSGTKHVVSAGDQVDALLLVGFWGVGDAEVAGHRRGRRRGPGADPGPARRRHRGR